MERFPFGLFRDQAAHAEYTHFFGKGQKCEQGLQRQGGRLGNPYIGGHVFCFWGLMEHRAKFAAYITKNWHQSLHLLSQKTPVI